ncbi:adenine nucleotide alpha hydrolases-like protein [Hesseltinella vesiculosa]|uniref:Adenine nucleotide alpha hydrolases-like protein n=1 Tax=Hesseltinella vesiculosa TaxID=101127 RepID=A0A1X2GVQ3_9FUNG|nr:adenine nucleotide alpha hydrolases-like protein [Hesseltinella vesiculosa]
MSSTEQPLSKRDQLIEKFSRDENSQRNLDRVVVVAIDPKSAEYVFEWAVKQFIRPEKDLVVLVHTRVMEPSAVAPFVDNSGMVEESDDRKRQESVKLLREFAHKLREQSIACQAIAMIGNPQDEILRKISEVKADVLLMGSRKLGKVKRVLLGSVSTYCVQNCPCSVIIARPNEDDAPKETKRRRSIFF